MKRSSTWFEVDREGLRELHAGFPCERLVLELIQNAWDEKSTVCDVSIIPAEQRGRRVTVVTVRDDNPAGFRDLADAYTLFRSTPKRNDPTKRGRFNYGEKIVLSRALSARISTTSGEVVFDKSGRHVSRSRRAAGSEIEVVLPRWSMAVEEQAIEFLKKLLPPASIQFFLNGTEIPARTPELVHEATLTTELLTTTDGATALTRSQRKTSIEFHRAQGVKAFLFEMGIPVCEIAGDYDLNVGQKVPLSQDRATVTTAFMQDLYAECVLALGDKLNVERYGTDTIQTALADDRVGPEAAKRLFFQVYGPNSAIQSHDPDSDQEAVRHGLTLVPSRTWGREVNDKFRSANVPTAHELFGRHGVELAKAIPDAEYTPDQHTFVAYVKMHAAQHYGDECFTVKLGRWETRPTAFNQDGNLLMFHVDRIDATRPVSGCTSLVLHELAHCKGKGHDGVYDSEFERLVDAHTRLLAKRPDLYRPFEPTLFS